jgi:hypothetical protein
MAIKITYGTKETEEPTFGNLKRGDFYLHNGELFMKIGAVYDKEELDEEVDCEHNLYGAEEIETAPFNAIHILTGQARDFTNSCKVSKCDTEINVLELV